MEIIDYNAICNLGADIDEIFVNALDGDDSRFEICDNIIKNKKVRVAKISAPLEKIDDKVFDTRCNRLLLTCCKKLDIEKYIKKYGAENVAIVVATTNSGTEEFETSRNPDHCELSNPALFMKKYLGTKNFCASVSTACSSGIKAFSAAKNLLDGGFAKCVIVAGTDSLTKVPIFGFDSLGVLTDKPTNPMSKNRDGINIGEAATVFVVGNDKGKIEIAGIGENTDVYHNTTPDPEAVPEIELIKKVLKNANLSAQDIDYVNLHGTGTISNDLTESVAVHTVFKNKVTAGSTKPLTGHCLGAASSLETALCCKLIETGEKKVFPHVFDGQYDENLPKIKLADKKTVLNRLRTCLNLSFGFGGTNAAIILRGKNDRYS